MTAEAFSSPFMYWVGMNIAPDTDAAALAEFNTFYSKTHVPEVLASNPGFVRGWRYELLQPDPRGDFGPRWLAVYEMDGEAAAHHPRELADGEGQHERERAAAEEPRWDARGPPHEQQEERRFPHGRSLSSRMRAKPLSVPI